MKNVIFVAAFIMVVLLTPGCSDVGSNHALIRISTTDMPYFQSLAWPPICSELPEGRLVITGTLVCPEGPDSFNAIRLYVFPDTSGACEESGGDGREGGGKGFSFGKSEYIQELEGKVLAYLEKKKADRKGQSGESSWIENCQGRGVRTYDSDECTYFHPDDGRFRIDFDQDARFKFGNKVLILAGIDSQGNAVLETMIYRIPNYVPELTDFVTQLCQTYGALMSGFAQGMLDALFFYPVERSVDIDSILATKNLYEQAFSVPPVATHSHYKSIGEVYGEQTRNIAERILDPLLKDGYLDVTGYIEYFFVSEGDNFNSSHFQYLFCGERDPIQNFTDSTNWLEELYTRYDITIQRTNLPNGGLDVHFIILDDNLPFADFTMTGSPSDPLLVTGTIGSHAITQSDYTPYFFKLFGVFFDEGWDPVLTE